MTSLRAASFIGLEIFSVVVPYVVIVRSDPGLVQGWTLLGIVSGLFLASIWQMRRDVWRGIGGLLVLAVVLAEIVILPSLLTMRT
jgi:hypothetical protein